jgi:hypothetical protein
VRATVSTTKLVIRIYLRDSWIFMPICVTGARKENDTSSHETPSSLGGNVCSIFQSSIFQSVSLITVLLALFNLTHRRGPNAFARSRCSTLLHVGRRSATLLCSLRWMYCLCCSTQRRALGQGPGRSMNQGTDPLGRSAQYTQRHTTTTWYERTHSYFGEYDATAFRPHGPPSTFQVLSRRSRLAPFRRGTT